MRKAVWRAAEELLGLELGALREDLAVGPVADPGAGHAALRLADDAELALLLERREGCVRGRLPRVGEDPRLTAVEGHGVGLAAAIHLDVESLGQGVDDGCADAVQAAGRGVRTAAELPAGVELGEDDLDTGEAGLRLDVHRDTTRVVAHLDALIGVEDDLDLIAVPAEGLVDGVVDDLPEAVHEATRVGGTDVHARSLAHRLEDLRGRRDALRSSRCSRFPA